MSERLPHIKTESLKHLVSGDLADPSPTKLYVTRPSQKDYDKLLVRNYVNNVLLVPESVPLSSDNQDSRFRSTFVGIHRESHKVSDYHLPRRNKEVSL